MNWGSVFYILGWLLSFFGTSMFVPAIVSYLAKGHDGALFLECGLGTIFLGVLLVLSNRVKEHQLSHKDGFILTFLTWMTLSFAGSLPIYFSGVSPTFVDAIFEAVSGLTTTGASVLSGLDEMDPAILLWRSIMQWLGGMGIVVLAIAILPFLGIGGMQLYKSEMPGVTKDKLQPRLKETAKLLWIVYLVLTFACACAYSLGGMSTFDAVCHAFTTLSTGGFSTHDASFAYFESIKLEYISIFFMLLGSLNFGLHYVFLLRGQMGIYTHNPELRLYALIIAASTALAVVVLVATEYDVGYAFRHALFNVVSVITTTGFATTDYDLWPSALAILFVSLMFVGGCSGSTSGGMKVMRIMLIMKQSAREIACLIHPRSIVRVKIADRRVHDRTMQAVWSFAGLYIFSFILISVALSSYGLDQITAFSAAAATLTSVGPGLAEVGPTANYAGVPEGAKLILCFAMLLGRLELFTLLIIFTPAFWRR